MYTPTRDDLVSVIKLLHNNGVEVSNSKAAYAELKQYETNPSFCVLLSVVFGADVNPVADLALPVDWGQYRQLAGITLKNNLAAARHALGEDAVKEAARHGLQTLKNPPDARLSRTAAQIVVKVIALTSFEWWTSSGLGDLPSILLNELLPADDLKTLSALYCLQYLMEDLPKKIGASSEHIIVKVSQLVLASNTPLATRKAGFRMCFNIYEQASLLDWNVDTFSPLQEGLSKASYFFANVCTSLLESSCGGDSAFMILVLRSCVFLLDYFDYFSQITPQDNQRYVTFWINNSVQIICNSQNGGDGNHELIAAAIDVISTVVDLYDRNGGETVLRFLVADIPSLIPTLVPALVQHSLLSSEEITNIMDSDDYRIRDTTAVSFTVKGGTKDISQDDMLDDDAAAMTLRSSALKCVDVLSSFSSDATFKSLIARIQALWNSNDWRAREAGIVLIGTIANGCAFELRGVLQSLVSQLIEFIKNPSEHVCVVSIAEWSLSRLSDGIVASFPDAMNTVIPLLSSRLQSTSKRVQITTVSALNTIHSALGNYGQLELLRPHLSGLLESICSCLPVYSTNNLAVLVDLLGKLILFLDDAAAAERLSGVLQAERQNRAAQFEKSYIALYVSGEPNVLLNKDIFSLDRATIAFLAAHPNNELATLNLTTWNGVLGDIMSRNVTDDADLIFNTLLICGAYITSVSTSALAQWVKTTSWALPTTAMHFLNGTEVYEIKAAAVTLLSALIQVLGPDALPPGAHDTLLNKAAQELGEAEDPQWKEISVRLITLITSKYPGELSTAARGALGAANGALRSDVFGESAHYFGRMAFDLCYVLDTLPGFVAYLRIDTIAQLMAATENSQEKSDATIHLFRALVQTPPEVFRNYLPAVIKVVYSWQQAASNYPETRETIQLFFRRANEVCPDLLQSILQSLPGTFGNMIVSFYQ
ncbi:transportin2-like protein [Leptomonas pyrrhocoris]|uniref:Transportin2-like protein n=1 Tax=Leptomonas pyrrhocoris TaxID=157538 RepID=A0A0N0DW92_LEPPY|nr:transportin2-like protein [Leptomonas pyrrhocoris]KPA81231.1 transportin2-like protein [Leptomonas pyrrhocoris]|eukprot:XP_015659670.1 transportin2-like protein [Leptomonas pyrrhocoris]